ncbi:DNA alkylation repair protein [Solimicrobium silvestre]|uniref:Putative DNA alkylation repair enzyme n=1 Tax=Solimicrobium silvestre TaxID=2099400 RepID=A0A2S9H281_9BURK|nr:DNA alkylation repair protein [Solimicrobium silvestre]PRC94053.1 putative DNA alkylation repair enzyme [Solimicrobium silvestre]
MKAQAFTREVECRLLPLANSDRAEAMSAYLLGQFKFLGLPAPIRRAAVKDLIKSPFDDAQKLLEAARMLWAGEEREYRYTAIDLLRHQSHLIGLTDLPAIRDLLLCDPWWETVDGLSAVISTVLHTEHTNKAAIKSIMDEWIVHESFWVRRSAMLHQLGWRLDTDKSRLKRYALKLGHEKEFFIRKAIGWALRDYARWDPEFVREFVIKYGDRLSSLTLRESSKHLDS